MGRHDLTFTGGSVIAAGFGTAHTELCIDGIQIRWPDEASDSRFEQSWLRRNAHDRQIHVDVPVEPKACGSDYSEAIDGFSYSGVTANDGEAALSITAFRILTEHDAEFRF
ncbi:hypothetical protein [Thalassococcus sp. S3]|uniref:hypothetical protein n=1 Tax=Thalassococcus sp. S3 TaxID=2017482 RepID=UPI001023FC69|nr:hypothetical protein [Thalassococcus sp. S3]QBF33952.1 hypothetical protein CFI11_22490 [Thalassococcus sp. S3]